MDKYIFPLKLGSLVLTLFWCIMMFSIWIWTACTSMVSAYQSNRWNEILTLTLLIGIYAIDFKRANLDTHFLIHWQENFSSEYKSATVTYNFYHVLTVFKNRKWSESFFFFCIQNDEHQTGSQNQALLRVERDLLRSLVKPAAQSRINTAVNYCEPGCLRFCPFGSWRPPRWRLHYILTVISFFPLHLVRISPVSIYDSSLVLPPCTKHGTVTKLRGIEYSAEV